MIDNFPKSGKINIANRIRYDNSKQTISGESNLEEPALRCVLLALVSSPFYFGRIGMFNEKGYAKQYYERNKEYFFQKNKKWRMENKDYIKQYRKRNKEYFRQKGKEWFLNSKEKYNNLYVKWASMKKRCFNPNTTGFRYWGGRGITVYEEWSRDFLTFYNWAIRNGYKKNLEIDRRNNDGNYTPENCRFVTRKENIRNSSRTILNVKKVKEIKILLKKKKLNNLQIGKMFGVTKTTIHCIETKKTWKDV